MSHSLDFVGLSEQMFSLKHLSSGTKEYCRRSRLAQTDDEFDVWHNYSQRLRYMVSNDLIVAASKFRVIQDTTVTQVSREFMDDLDLEARVGNPIGSVLIGDFDLTLRESCNKIIHATTFSLVFQNARNERPRYTYGYWNGICQLCGSHGKSMWKVALNVYRWCDAMDYFLEGLQDNVDW